jgi:hypothetical protein
LGQVLALTFHGHLFLLVLAPSSHSSGRAGRMAPCNWSTRCSSLALRPSRSFAVLVGFTGLAIGTL